MSRYFAHGGAVVALLASLVGCSSDETSTSTPNSTPTPTVAVAPTETTPQAKVRWTIDGEADQEDCVRLGTPHVEVTLFDADGNAIVSSAQPCAVFATTVPTMRPVDSAQVRLLDAGGKPRTDPLIGVASGSEVLVDIPSRLVR